MASINGPDLSDELRTAAFQAKLAQVGTKLADLTEANTAMAQRLSAATALLEDLRNEAELRRSHFGNVNDINFEPGIATDANHEVRRIEAFLVSPDAVVQQRADAVRAAYEAFNALRGKDEPCWCVQWPHHPGCTATQSALTALREAFPELQS